LPRGESRPQPSASGVNHARGHLKHQFEFSIQRRVSTVIYYGALILRGSRCRIEGMTRTKKTAKAETSLIDRYLEHSQGLAVSFLFILPLLVVYEMGILIVQPPATSWAGDLIRWLLHGAFGRWGALAFNLCAIIAIVGSLLSFRGDRAPRFGLYPVVLVESLLYGLLLITVVPPLVQTLPLAQAAGPSAAGVIDDLVLSIGAGVYEEIVFRLVLMSAVYFLALKATGANWFAVVAAIFISSIAFSACHYIGRIDVSSMQFIRSFSFRALSGVFLAALYIYRGLAVACYAHAFYDILVVAMA